MVNKELVKKWVAALRSGDYKQGREQLRNGDQFCCLGVACDIVKEQIGIDWNGDRFDKKLSFLPDSVTGVFGEIDSILDTTLPITYKTFARIGGKTLIGYNDRGATFEEIADIIEEQYLG